MRVVSTSASYRAAICSLALFAPLAAFEAFLASRVPWWKLTFPLIAWSAGAAFGVSMLLGIAMLRGRGWVLPISTVLASAWVAFSAGLAIRLRHPGLGYFVILLAIACYCILSWIRHEMERTYFDPDLAWYQGLPKGIPDLFCELDPASARAPWKVGRIDREGAFIFWERSEPVRVEALKSARRGTQELLFRFRDREMRCAGVAMRELTRASGVGFRFAGLTQDQSKDLGDFVETLRGEGYVE